MPLRRPNRITPRVTKALPAGLAHAGGRIRTGAEAMPATLDQHAVQGIAAPLPRDLYPYAFGPGIPLLPAPLDPTRSDTGRAQPRITDYPVSWNLNTSGTGRLVPWKTLRDAANLPIIRDCLRIRKQEIAGLEWEIGISKRAVAAQQEDAGDQVGRHAAEADLRAKLLPEIVRLTDWWSEPDRGQGLHFEAWVMQLLEEHLVLDALAVYPRRTLGGDLWALEILDGSTVKPLLDHRGGRPAPPHPAYQQLLHGFPRGEFTADTTRDETGVEMIPGGYPADQLLYVRREVRTWTPYGMSAVEMALLDLDTWMKRVGWLRAEYTDGSVPAGWLINRQQQGATASWSPSQVAEYERALNDYYSGDTSARRRVRVLPPGWEPDTTPEVGEKFRPDYDLHLLKLLVNHFDLTIHELGFTETQGLGSAGHSEGQEALNARRGSQPTLLWLSSLLTRISRAQLGMPAELEFRWVQMAEENVDADRLVVEQVHAGLLSINEGRDQLGRPRYAFPEADKAALLSPTTGTVTFLDGVEERQAQQLQAEQDTAAALAQAGGPPAAGKGPDGKPGSGADNNPTRVARDPDPGAARKTAEAAAYRRWAAKTTAGGRRFVLHALTDPQDLAAHGIDPARVTLIKAGDGAGKAEGDPSPERVAQWPGWQVDLALAAVYVPLIVAAVRRVLPSLRGLARVWVDQQGHGAPTTPTGLRGTAEAFLRDRGVTLGRITDALRPVIADLATEASWVGQASAQALVDGEPVDWAGWTPGHPAKARELLDDPPPLPDVLDAAQHRVDALAQALASSADGGALESATTANLEHAATDPAPAERLAITVGTQTQGTAALRTYRRNRIPASTWLTANDTRVCPTCIVNEQRGPVPLGEPFPSGHTEPPGHPRCRCCLLPSSIRISPERLDHHPDYQRRPGEHRDPPTARLEGR